MTSSDRLGNEFCRSQEIQQLRMRISGCASRSQAVLGDLLWLSGFRWKTVGEQNQGLFTNSQSFSLCFWPCHLFPATSLKQARTSKLCLTTPPHITLHPAHTCRPAVYCHYNYNCQKKSTNVLIWQPETFITNNWAPCFLCERLRILNQEAQFYVCGKYTVFGTIKLQYTFNLCSVSLSSESYCCFPSVQLIIMTF